jgi:glycosyltransferase involved in cell wall biosynthesis
MIKGLSILVFALNEEKKILSTLKLINSNIKKVKIQFEIIVINDGSTDKTIDIINIYKKNNKRIKVLDFKKNKGITRSLQEGIRVAKYDKLTWFPGDDSFLSKNLRKFFEFSKTSDLVNGYRNNKFVFKSLRKSLTVVNQFILSLLFKQEIKDVHGLFIFKTSHLKKLKFYCTRYSIMVEILPTLLNFTNYNISYVKIYLNRKNLNSSQTLSFQTILDFANTWLKSFYYYKILK